MGQQAAPARRTGSPVSTVDTVTGEPIEQTAATGRAWSALPRSLRMSALVAGCLILVAGAGYLLFLVLARLGSLTLAIGSAVLLTALIEPVTRGLRRLGAPGWLAAAVSVAVLLGVVVLPVVLLIDQARSEFPDLGTKLDDGMGRIRDWLVTGPLSLDAGQVDAIRRSLVNRLQDAAPDPLAGAGTAVEVLAAILIAAFLTFYFLKDGRTMRQWVLQRFTEPRRSRLAEASRVGWDTLRRFTQGMFIVTMVDVTVIGLALVLLHVPLVLPLMLLVFIGGFIPYAGATLSGSAAVLVALVSNGPTDALILLLVVLLEQNFEGYVLEPLIVGRAVRLHPAVVLVGVAAGALIGGVFGALVATPILAVTYRIWTHLTEAPR